MQASLAILKIHVSIRYNAAHTTKTLLKRLSHHVFNIAKWVVNAESMCVCVYFIDSWALRTTTISAPYDASLLLSTLKTKQKKINKKYNWFSSWCWTGFADYCHGFSFLRKFCKALMLIFFVVAAGFFFNVVAVLLPAFYGVQTNLWLQATAGLFFFLLCVCCIRGSNTNCGIMPFCC